MSSKKGKKLADWQAANPPNPSRDRGPGVGSVEVQSSSDLRVKGLKRHAPFSSGEWGCPDKEAGSNADHETGDEGPSGADRPIAGGKVPGLAFAIGAAAVPPEIDDTEKHGDKKTKVAMAITDELGNVSDPLADDALVTVAPLQKKLSALSESSGETLKERLVAESDATSADEKVRKWELYDNVMKRIGSNHPAKFLPGFYYDPLGVLNTYNAALREVMDGSKEFLTEALEAEASQMGCLFKWGTEKEEMVKTLGVTADWMQDC